MGNHTEEYFTVRGVVLPLSVPTMKRILSQGDFLKNPPELL